jgi:hypothetical protein
MLVEIQPEPREHEREAILAALEAALAESRPPVSSAWWRAGLREDLDEDELA